MLELKELKLIGTDDPRPALELKFNVIHNVGALPTTLECDMAMRVARNSGKVTASLVLANLEADDVEAAREKMALWCDRMAAALRGAARVPFEVPAYEKRTFELASLPQWLQREFAVVAERFKRTRLTEVEEDRQDVVADLVTQHHPLIYISGALDHLLNFSYSDD